MNYILTEEGVKYCEERYDDMEKYPQLSFDHTFLEMDRDQQMEAWWKKVRALWDINASKYFYDAKPTMGLDANRYGFF